MKVLREVESALREYVDYVDMHIYSDSTADCMIATDLGKNGFDLDDVLDMIQDEFPEIEIVVKESGTGNNMRFIDFQLYHDPQGLLR
tara:strand:- start:8313 stop:8573 length:261 start_codon:yes stop_codon:yes gene_type:complete